MSLLLGFNSGFSFSLGLRQGFVALVWGALGLFAHTTAAAAEADELEEEAVEEAVAESEADSAETEADKAHADDPSESKDKERVAAGHNSVWEDPKEQYLFIGARYRLQRVPQFLQTLFAEGGSPLWVHTPGVEFGIRNNGFETNIFAMLGMYSLDSVPFKGKSDPELAWELIDANYKVLFLGADFMWSTPEFTDGLSVVYGAGIGLGLVFGDMNRTQAYPNPDGSGGFLPCANAFDPRGAVSPIANYCDAANNHYNGYVEPSWADNGSSPLIFPWLGGQVGLRYKAHKRFVGRLELGVTITSLFFGIGADYGL